MRSKVFESAAVALHRCGYSVLPILSVDAPYDSRGKAPGVYGGVSQDGTKGPWYLLKEWEKYCIAPAPEAKAAAWGRAADDKGGGLGVACGYGGLLAIDVDNPDLIEPIRAILPPIMVEKFGRKGFTAFYRSDHPRDDEDWWAKKNYKDADKRGLLDFLAAGSQTVTPPSPHKDGGHYVWTSERTLLNTRLEALPLFTDEHREAMEEVLRRYGWGAPEPAVARSKAIVERPVRAASESRCDDDDFDSIATARRGEWLPKLELENLRRVQGGWRAVASFRSSGDARPHVRGFSLSIRDDGPIRDHGGHGYNNATLVAECRGISTADAYAWLRAELGLPDAPPITLSSKEPEPIVPFQDDRLPLADAEEKVANIIASFFDEAVPAYVAWSNAWKLDAAAPRRTKLPPRAQGWSVRVEMGIGKTHTAIVTIADRVRCHRQVVYVVPNHKLAEEVNLKFKEQKIDAAIYRGAERKDPRNPARDMCLNPKARKAAESLGISVRKAVCVDSAVDIVPVRCPLASQCGVEWQRTLQPQLWIVPSSLLMIHRPDFIPEPDAVVIDERFTKPASINRKSLIPTRYRRHRSLTIAGTTSVPH